MICPNCGANLPDTAKMCHVCKTVFQNGNTGGIQRSSMNNPQPQQMHIKNPNWNKKPKTNNGCLSHVLTVIAALIILIGWAAVSMNRHRNDNDSDGYSDERTVEVTVEEDVTTEEETEEPEVTATVTDAVIYEGNDVIVELKSLEGNTLNFYIENNSSKNLSSSMHAFAINGVMADNNIYDMHKSIAANSKANVTFDIPKTLESGYEVDQIKRMDFLIWFYDDDKSFKDFDTGVLTVETNLADGMLDNDIGNEELLNESGISYKLIEKDEDKLVIGINNNSETFYNFDMKNVVVNGFTLDIDYNLDVYDKLVFPGCAYPITLEYNWSSQEDFKKLNGIEKIESVALNFGIRPNDDYFSESSTSQILIDY